MKKSTQSPTLPNTKKDDKADIGTIVTIPNTQKAVEEKGHGINNKTKEGETNKIEEGTFENIEELTNENNTNEIENAQGTNNDNGNTLQITAQNADDENLHTLVAVTQSLRTLPGAFRVEGPNPYSQSGNSQTGSTPIPPPDDEGAQQGGELQRPDDNIAVETDTNEVVCHVPSAYLVQEEDEENANTPEIEIAKAEKVKPYLQRKEGQSTIIIVFGLMACLVILLGIFLTRESNREEEGSGDALAATLPSDAPTLPPTFDPRPTLAIVQERGIVNCGIDDLEEGNVNLNAFNIDQCRAVAATIFGDPTKINLVVVSDENRFAKLDRREVDVLFAGTPFTLENLIKERTTGGEYALGSPYYGAEFVYLGLPLYVQCVNDRKRYEECEDLSICAVDTPEIKSVVLATFPASFARFGLFPEMESSLKNGTCNVLVSDTYRIYGSKAGLQDDVASGKYIMSDTSISRNLLSSVVRLDDHQWFDIVEGSKSASFRAAQIGLSKGNGEDCPMNSTDNNEISFHNVPRCVGNTREMFEASLTPISVSYGPNMNIKLPSLDGPNFASLECDDCKDTLEHPRPQLIRERGMFKCAVVMDPRYNLTTTSLPTLVSTKFCEMMSVAIFQGDPDAVNITYIDRIDLSAFPREFDAVTGLVYEEKFFLETDFNIDNMGKMITSLPYYYVDGYWYKGTLYDGTGPGLSFLFHNDDNALNGIAIAIITAVVYAQRQGITRDRSDKMPLIHLLGDSLTFMLRDVVGYAGNYDDIINEALAESDGTVPDRGWNTVIPSYVPVPPALLFYCDYSASCGDQCVYSEEFEIFLC